jgi:hypothetical protein
LPWCEVLFSFCRGPHGGTPDGPENGMLEEAGASAALSGDPQCSGSSARLIVFGWESSVKVPQNAGRGFDAGSTEVFEQDAGTAGSWRGSVRGFVLSAGCGGQRRRRDFPAGGDAGMGVRSVFVALSMAIAPTSAPWHRGCRHMAHPGGWFKRPE